MNERMKSILLVGMEANFVESFGMSERAEQYRVQAVDGAIEAVKELSNYTVDAVVFRYDQPIILWDAFIEIVHAIHGTTRVVILFDGSCDKELQILATPIDLCLPSTKEPKLCFEYIHRLFETDQKPISCEMKLSSRGLNNFEIDLKTESVKKNGEEVALTHLEYLILVSLIEHRDKTMNRQEIFSEIYKFDDVTIERKDRRIDMHIVKLRQKIGAPHIRSIRGRGYRWDGLSISEDSY